jgi:hypothetical protein
VPRTFRVLDTGAFPSLISAWKGNGFGDRLMRKEIVSLTGLLGLCMLSLMPIALRTELSSQKKPLPEVPEALQTTLATYLREQALTPEEYVVSKFRDHDIVLLGEHHFIKHDVELVQALIPLLYAAGIRDLGIEFGCRELQDRADALVTAETYDEGLARWLMFQWGSYWPYVEYLGLYRKAWEMNRSLPAGAPKFRIVGLDYKAHWDFLRENMPPAQWKAVLDKGPRDAYMARTIIDEFVKKKRKALVYVGQHHAFTRYHAPDYDFEKKKLLGEITNSAGNIVWRKIRDRAFQICLHYPWQTIAGARTYDYPVDGVVDSIMKEFPGERFGFDVAGSPFGRLGDDGTVYAVGRKKFVFSDFCDGYIYEKPFGEYQGCSVDPFCITADNFAEAVANLPNAAIKKKIKTRVQFLEKMRWDADFRRLYPDLI